MSQCRVLVSEPKPIREENIEHEHDSSQEEAEARGGAALGQQVFRQREEARAVTVQELIEQLSEFAPETRVLMDCDGVLVDVTGGRKIVVSPSITGFSFREEDFGTVAEFLAAEWVDDEDKAGAFEAVEVGR